MAVSRRKSQLHSHRKKHKWLFLLQQCPFYLFRRSLSTTETVYAFLSISFIIFIYIIVAILDSSSPAAPFLSSTNSHGIQLAGRGYSESTIFQSRFSAIGSSKQLQHLIQNITLHTHRNSKDEIPSSLIVAVAVNYAYRKLALNFICNLNRLNISNYVVFAMDKPVFDYLSQRNAHVFFHDLSYETISKDSSSEETNVTLEQLQQHQKPQDHPHHHHRHRHLHQHYSQHHRDSNYHLHNRRKLLSTSNDISEDDVQGQGNDTSLQFGTIGFVETSRRKSLLVLRLLTLGYSVLFSDVDVVWVNNPISTLLQHTGHFVIQSDRSNQLPDEPLNYNINSGFYLARAAPQTIIAMRAIIKYAYAIRRSEQKAFNHVLCGAFKDHVGGPGMRIGSTECKYSHAGTKTQILPLDEFPNGSDNLLWKPVTNFSLVHPNITAVHANYVPQREEKEKRIRDIGFWLHSENVHSRDECILPYSISP